MADRFVTEDDPEYRESCRRDIDKLADAIVRDLILTAKSDNVSDQTKTGEIAQLRKGERVGRA